MIQEAWDFITTKSTKRARSLGYLYQSVSLSFRARRCAKHWREHNLECHEQVHQAALEAIKKYPDRKSVVVLGSGELMEVPLSLLESLFEDIILIDIVHSKTAREKVKNNPKIQLIEMDVSGLPQKLEELNKSNPAVEMPDLFESPPALVISANLLSQLANVPCQYLHKKGWDEEELSSLTYNIQKAHFEGLRKIDCVKLIFSDYRLEFLNSKMTILDIEDTVAPDLLPKFNHRWLWNIAPIPEYSQTKALRMRMFSYIF